MKFESYEVVCIRQGQYCFITPGKNYIVSQYYTRNDLNYICIVDDINKHEWYLIDYFESVEHIRNEKLKLLL